MESDKRTTVCVTGATGFIASHIILQLLKEGYAVRGTVRSLKDKTKYQYFDDLLSQHNISPDLLTFYEANLTAEESFDSAVQDCDYVIHAASPYVLNTQNPQKELVEPAIKGTLTVLESVVKSPSVKRVVLTSSVAAITDSPDSSKVYTEKDWNNDSSLTRNPYYYSKKMAEEAAWNFMKEKERHFDLVVMNPFVTIGPELSPHSINTSNEMLLNILTGKYPGILGLHWGFVDVRDVARAHILGFQNPKAEGRHLLCSRVVPMKEVVDLLKKHYPNYSLPSMNLNCTGGNALVKVASYFQPKGTGDYLRTNLGKEFKFDNSKAKDQLGVEFRDPTESILDTIENLIQQGHLPDLRNSKNEVKLPE